MQPPKCSKCGRRLTNPESIARGMGPKCAGASGRRRKLRVHLRRTKGVAYANPLVATGQILLPVFWPDLDEIPEIPDPA